ncbi:MAG: hypothetical protein A2Z04_00760 [Chloroflexi bacterium RBG_16_57_9]|nr:MAG: hypothetical protein A2Z04_00760 [Chloroflexi bacterium RBG_16_57_9]
MTLTELDREVRILELAIQTLRAKVDYLQAQMKKSEVNGRPQKFEDVKGIWHGVDLSFEDIQAAEYKVPEDLL